MFCIGLYADSTDYLVVGGARMILQEVVLGECEIRGDCEVNLAEMEKMLI